MDKDYLALCSLIIFDLDFEYYSCTSSFPIGVDTNEFLKLMRFAEDEDRLMLMATEGGDILSLTFRSQGMFYELACCCSVMGFRSTIHQNDS